MRVGKMPLCFFGYLYIHLYRILRGQLVFILNVVDIWNLFLICHTHFFFISLFLLCYQTPDTRYKVCA